MRPMGAVTTIMTATSRSDEQPLRVAVACVTSFRFGYELRYIVSGLPTPDRAAIQRRPLTPHTVPQVWPFWALLLFVKERTIRRTI